MPKQSLVLVALGANLPSAAARVGETLQTALHIVHKNRDTSITGISKFWKTPAFPAGSGPDYLNGIMSLRTTLSPEQILNYLHQVEQMLGRDRNAARWSARVLDLDLIAYDQRILPDKLTQRHWVELHLEQQKTEMPDRLILPHPRMQDRGFVLAPLAEIAPDWVHPVSGKTVKQMFDALPTSVIAEMKPCSIEMPILA